jgi:hypothetical protein
VKAVLSGRVRLRKLKAMSAKEIAHRVRYDAAIRVERSLHARGRLAAPDRLRRDLVPSIADASDWRAALRSSRTGSQERFLNGVRDPEVMRRLFDSRFAAERRTTAHHAAEAMRRRFKFFGRTFEYGADIDWQADPVSGKRWPSVFHADVPVHGGDAGFGDVKHVWELSRHQFLIDLGKEFFLGRRIEHVHAIRDLVRSWIAGNPYATGVNWSCALEPAFRVFSWLWAYHLTVDALDDAFHVEWLGAMFDHGRFIEKHLELYSSPYNHLIGEAAALYMLGMFLPECRHARRWRQTGKRILEERLPRQFYEDGGSVEQSTFYHHATVGFYLLAVLSADASGEHFSHRVHAAIERGLSFSLALQQPDGTTPSIGGADDGKPIRMEHLPFWDFRPYLAIGAVLFERADFKAAAGRFFEDALWLLGPDGLRRFDDLAPQHDDSATTVLPASGYVVLRGGESNGKDYVCFDCGEQAAGMRTDGIPNSMHGHADCLSIVAWLGGRPVLVDSGFFSYNCGDAWEAHFRETAAHNTARVDGRDQARHIGKMAWSHSYRAALEGTESGPPLLWALGSHDGYVRLANGVVHRRAVALRPDGYLLVYDEFDGAGEHELEVNYQFAPGTLEHADGHVLFDGRVGIVWSGSGNWSSAIRTAGDRPDEGWIARSLGVKVAAPRLTLRASTAGPLTTLLTVFASSADGRLVRMSGADLATNGLIRVDHADSTDWIGGKGIGSPLAVQTDGYVAACRMAHGAIVDEARIGGTFARFDPRGLSGHAASAVAAGAVR